MVISLVENYFEEGLEDIAKHQEQLWERVREILTRLASLSYVAGGLALAGLPLFYL